MSDSLDFLVQHLEERGVLKSKEIKNALLTIDRIKFLPESIKELAYRDHPLVLAEEQTISQPTTVVFMLELLEINAGQKILDIGAGSGWVSCLMGYITGEGGRVYAYEINEVVGMMGQENVEKNNPGNVEYYISNASAQWKEHAPYDRIHSGAAFREIPMHLKSQLRVGGVLVAPTQDGHIRKVTRLAEDEYKEEQHYGFTFVPFVEE